ncbi:MAG: hypothetical protein ABIH59_01855 [archaeon]
MKKILILGILALLLMAGFLITIENTVSAKTAEQICKVWVVDDPDGWEGHYEEQVCEYITSESLHSYT